MADNKITRILRSALNMVPGYPSLSGLMYKKGYGPREALMDLQNQIVPFNGAYQDFINDRPQDWNRNAIRHVEMLIGLSSNMTAPRPTI